MTQKRNSPLGLPEGSIRALLVIMFSVAIVVPLFKSTLYQTEIPQGTRELLMFLFGALTQIISRYFESRKGEYEDWKSSEKS